MSKSRQFQPIPSQQPEPILFNKLQRRGFHGSYRAADITFLLRQDQIQPIDIADKEHLIQSGQAHYSEMISLEAAPSPEHVYYFEQAMQTGAMRLAQEIQMLANQLRMRFSQQAIVLVSLVRAGVPIGVLLKHCIAQHQACFHYGISIIRDRGIDHAALNAIIATHGADCIVFVDGWTGKGAIAQELRRSLRHRPELFDPEWDMPRLVTLADVAGCTWLSASAEDWLIPSGVLGAVVSGLTSRTILIQDSDLALSEKDCFNPHHWHACILYPQLQAHDISVQFVQRILQLMDAHPTQQHALWQQQDRAQQFADCHRTIEWIQQQYQINDINRIKPSIAEATRAVLRRIPDRILVQSHSDPNVQLLIHLAQQHQVPIDTVGTQLGPYRAATLIQNILE